MITESPWLTVGKVRGINRFSRRCNLDPRVKRDLYTVDRIRAEVA